MHRGEQSISLSCCSCHCELNQTPSPFEYRFKQCLCIISTDQSDKDSPKTDEIKVYWNVDRQFYLAYWSIWTNLRKWRWKVQDLDSGLQRRKGHTSTNLKPRLPKTHGDVQIPTGYGALRHKNQKRLFYTYYSGSLHVILELEDCPDGDQKVVYEEFKEQRYSTLFIWMRTT